jgi:hypothetical protein
MLFSLEEDLKRARRTGALGFAKTQHTHLREKYVRAALIGRSNQLSRSIVRRPGRLQANTFQAEARSSCFALDELPSSCPHLLLGFRLDACLWRRVRPSATQALRSCCSQPGAKPRLPYSLYKSVRTRNRTQLSRTHSAMGSPWLIVEDLQNRRKLERSTRFATRNRKNRVNIGLSAQCRPS